MVHKELQKHAAETRRCALACKEELWNVKKRRMLKADFEKVGHLCIKNFMKRCRVDEVEDCRKNLELVAFLLSRHFQLVGRWIGRGSRFRLRVQGIVSECRCTFSE